MSQETTQKLSYLGFQSVHPSPVLRPYVRSYWVIQSELEPGEYREEFMHPGGGYGIVFNFGDGFHFNRNLLPRSIFLDGCNTVSRMLGFEGTQTAIGIRFHPGRSYPFIKVPLYELKNDFILLDLLDQKHIMPLYEQIGTANTLQQQIDYIETWLLKRLIDTPDNAKLILTSLSMIKKNTDTISMRTLADDLHISQRQLERLYKTHVGMSPKNYAQLMRIERARNKLKLVENFSGADISAALGYYDQSHFIREFKSVVGMTPLGYMQRSQAREQTGRS